MMFEELFSKRYNLRPTPLGLIQEDVPESARIGLFYILEDYLQYIDHINYYSDICMALRIPYKERNTIISSYGDDLSYPIQELLMSCDWWRVYDICEITYKSTRSHRYDLSEKINKLLVDEQLSFTMKDGKIEKIGSGYIDAEIKEARYLLKEPEFRGADRHFEKAIKSLNERPKPDVENCIKDAIAAIESVGRVIVNDENALLSDIIKSSVKKGIIPQPLDQTFQKVYAYRGNEPGVAHGAVGESKITVDEAELILAMSAAMILYLVKKRSQLS
jgi:hypothetical protein